MSQLMISCVASIIVFVILTAYGINFPTPAMLPVNASAPNLTPRTPHLQYFPFGGKLAGLTSPFCLMVTHLRVGRYAHDPSHLSRKTAFSVRVRSGMSVKWLASVRTLSLCSNMLTKAVLILLHGIGDLELEDILFCACGTTGSALALLFAVLFVVLVYELLNERLDLLHGHLLALVHANGVLEESSANN